LLPLLRPPLFFSSCMWAACPVPNRRTGTSWREGRRERESWYSTLLPSSTIRWRPGGPETPTGTLSPRHTILSRSALSGVSTPAPASKARYQATKWKWTAPSKSSRERTLCFYSFSLLRKTSNINKISNTNINIKKRRRFFFMDPLDLRPMRWWHMHACIWTYKKWVQNLGGTM